MTTSRGDALGQDTVNAAQTCIKTPNKHRLLLVIAYICIYSSSTCASVSFMAQHSPFF